MIREHDWRTNHEAREETISEAVRTVSKIGSIAGFEEVFRELAAFLTKEEVVQLYEALRQSRRPESEWRHEFLAIFHVIQDSDLPPIMYDQPPAGTRVQPQPRTTLSDEDIPF